MARYGIDDATNDILAMGQGGTLSSPFGASVPAPAIDRPGTTQDAAAWLQSQMAPGGAFAPGQQLPAYGSPIDPRLVGLRPIQSSNDGQVDPTSRWPMLNPYDKISPYNIDTGFIRGGGEGGQKNDIYTVNGFRHSGPTVASGVDLGSKSATPLKSWGLTDDEIVGISPYFNYHSQDAVEYVKQHPLHILDDEANRLDAGAMAETANALAAKFDDANPSANFIDLPPQAQTVITSLGYNMGVNTLTNHPIWDDITSNNWNKVVDQLGNWGGKKGIDARRLAERDKLREAVGNDTLPR